MPVSDDGDSGTTTCIYLPMREIWVPSLRHGIPLVVSSYPAALCFNDNFHRLTKKSGSQIRGFGEHRVTSDTRNPPLCPPSIRDYFLQQLVTLGFPEVSRTPYLLSSDGPFPYYGSCRLNAVSSDGIDPCRSVVSLSHCFHRSRPRGD